MEPTSLTHSPFAVLTFIVAPALLTNSSSVLALSTINRTLRTRERMHELFARNLDCGSKTNPALPMLIQCGSREHGRPAKRGSKRVNALPQHGIRCAPQAEITGQPSPGPGSVRFVRSTYDDIGNKQ